MDGQPKGPGYSEVDDQFKFGRLLNRQVGRLGAFENLVYVRRCATKIVYEVLAIAHQTTSVHLLAEREHRGHPAFECKVSNLLSLLDEECVSGDDDRSGTLLVHAREGTLDFLRCCCLHGPDLQVDSLRGSPEARYDRGMGLIGRIHYDSDTGEFRSDTAQHLHELGAKVS